MKKTCALILGGLSLAVSMDAFPQAQSTSAAGGGVEDIYIVRSVRESRTFATEFCAAAKTGFSADAGAEDKFTLHSTAARGSDGLVTSSKVKPVGSLHGCFGATADALVFNFYAEGAIGAMTFKGRGQCVWVKRNHPEEGMTPVRCYLDLDEVSSPYTGGLVTSNAINSFQDLGDVSLPRGYTQVGIFTLRLWKRR
jgi:hypothetical protein